MFFAKRNEFVKCPKALDICMKFLDEYVSEPKGRGRYELQDGIYCVVTGYDTIPGKDSIIEAHCKYADLHCSLLGEERVQFGFVDELQIISFDEEKDFVNIRGVLSNEVIAKPGTVLCFMPNDAHRMKMGKNDDVSEKIEKIIFKIPLGLCEHMW